MLFDPFEYVVGVIINRFVAGLGALPRDEDDEDDEDDALDLDLQDYVDVEEWQDDDEDDDWLEDDDEL